MLSWLAYRQLEAALMAGAEQRVVNAAQQVGGMLHASLLRVRRDCAQRAASPAVTGFLARPTPSGRARLTRLLTEDMASNTQILARSLWSRDRRQLVAVGAAASGPAELQVVPPLEATRGALPRSWASALRIDHAGVVYDVVAPALGESGDTLGFLVETRRLNAQNAQQIGSLISASGSFLLGDVDGSLWTDLSHRVNGPALASRMDTPLSYVRAGTERLGAQDAVPSAPWVVAIEMPRTAALAPARRFLEHSTLIALVLVLLGALAAWGLSRSYTGPLEAVTRAAEGMAAGDYSQHVPDDGRDELGRLAGAFNIMAERVAEASRVLGQQAVTAQAVAEQLEAANQELERALRDAEEAREAAVHAGEEREKTLKQLQQAQKMEAVGQLAGGVAHDFNNLLTVITSYSTMLLADLPPESRQAEDIREIHEAASRASALTRQLLAFSRRQMLQPRVVEINSVVRNVEKMLRRLLREDIVLETKLGSDAGAVNADPGQLEQIVINLAVNARDAMSSGGRLTIETARLDAAPGSWVVLTVSDTGHGMDEATKAQIFDPFFTTKPVGQGTGLGLATVYGIVKQSGGNIYVTSAPGCGTSFQIHLPLAAAEAEPESTGEPRSARPTAARTERILLVEDEPNVRRIARRMLERNGYAVIEAANGAEALRILESRREPIALVLTDVVMPEMGGRELAARLEVVSPTSRVLFMSGYAEDAVLHQQLVAAEARLLEKPFTLETLTRKVREALAAA